MAFKRQRVCKKWYEVITKAAGDLVDAMMSYTKRINYGRDFRRGNRS
ncbi:hypothetical protein [Candidatus Enterovibrio escicola]|nr:hypothetical protein [Candidatus Enterovibrio escacola]